MFTRPRNPDKDFVLHGTATPIRYENPRLYQTNSERTLSTGNLSQSTIFARNTLKNETGSKIYEGFRSTDTQRLADSVGSILRNGKKSSLKKDRRKRNGELSLDLQSLNSSLNKSLNKSVSFTEHNYGGHAHDRDSDDEESLMAFENELQKLIDSDLKENEDYEKKTTYKSRNLPESQWYIEPIHLRKDAEFPVFESLGVSTKSISPHSRTTGMLGTELAQKRINSEIAIPPNASNFFPVTSRQSALRNALSQPLHSNISKGKSSNFLASSHQPASKAFSDYNYLVASQQFVDGEEVVSPYRYELAKLRMERLRLEEDTILESKRQKELERIRGPKPKW
ncbi:uncharacterized protein LOC117103044 isoform X1 [Anneissia japonica]|uniref:uncharacterized protein LOC117103044 isoform X1 n=1 Tax=Anneissia japonica TaxID=1529436 RepID=UPI00142584DD|nr:uncharacterized protein LOC117103044 isoform X1 [Anneissia japonica]